MSESELVSEMKIVESCLVREGKVFIVKDGLVKDFIEYLKRESDLKSKLASLESVLKAADDIAFFAFHRLNCSGIILSKDTMREGECFCGYRTARSGWLKARATCEKALEIGKGGGG